MDLKSRAILLLWRKPGPQGSAHGPVSDSGLPRTPSLQRAGAAPASSLLDSKSVTKPLAHASVSLVLLLTRGRKDGPTPLPMRCVRSLRPALRLEDVHAHPSNARTLHRTALCLSFHLHSLRDGSGFLCVYRLEHRGLWDS